MKKNLEDIHSIEDTIRYCRMCLSDAPADQPKWVTAGWLVGIHSYAPEQLEDWRDTEPLLEELLAAAEALELETENLAYIDEYWSDILKLLPQLEAKYL